MGGETGRKLLVVTPLSCELSIDAKKKVSVAFALRKGNKQELEARLIRMF